jgi:hypothetical protein
VSLLASSSDFVVESSVGFYALAWLLVVSVAAVIPALKARWGWLLAGCIFGGLLWLVSAWLDPRPAVGGRVVVEVTGNQARSSD